MDEKVLQYVDWVKFFEKESANKNYDLIWKYSQYIDWFMVSILVDFTEEMLWEFRNLIDWRCISKYQMLSPEIKDRFKTYIDASRQ